MLPTLFIAHGGGPCFFMEWPGDPWKKLEAYLRALPATLPTQPSSILVISAHWESALPTVTSAPNPSLIYDYAGFPAQTYLLRYDAPGSPELASRVRALLAVANIDSAENQTRGLDHGVFVPLKVIYPDATIPIVQLSLQPGYDPARHHAIGAALAPLRKEGVLIVGSGMSYHNLGELFDPSANDGAAFDAWLTGVVVGDPIQREERLCRWRAAPQALIAHPHADHLAPLFVAAGAAQGAQGLHDYSDVILGKHLSGYRFI
ncbi:MAG TPA: class III extradiol ring-cleavage dioxygenase [Candidatus Dormibacteraeota bacterium]|nr:class III extradiol ring-cleavage dioxygenase [Candidatus Dormibacteraeota bacterium]